MMVEVIVEYDYSAKEPDELTIKKGDVIRDVIKKQGGWWEGMLNDKRGMFPDNFVKPIDKDPVVIRNKKDVSRIRQCRVVFSYCQEHEDELNLKVGDVINIIGEEEEGWWRGSLNGKEGVFPSNFVEEMVSHIRPKPSSRDDIPRPYSEIDNTKAPSLPVKPAKQLCEVKFDYKAQNEDELTLKEGDIVTLISKDGQDPGWWKGELNGKSGVFPDNFVVLITGNEEKITNKEEKKTSVVITETGAIKPSSIASQRKSLEVKNDKTNSDTSKTPPIPGKKPIISLKKSPSGSGSGLFSEIRKKLVDVVDGATGSKPKTEPIEHTPKENHNENVFDQVERRPLLSDVRATRAKAPGRRLPTSIYKEEENTIPNGNVEHLYAEPIETNLNSSDEHEGSDAKPKLREWEKHKAPWLDEMKLNQAKRTSTSPGPEPKLKLTPTNDVEESKSAKNSPVEKEVSPIDMSKSVSSLSAKPKTPPVEVEKVPVVKAKPAVPPMLPSNRHSLGNNININKEPPPMKPSAPIQPKISPIASKPTSRSSLPEKTVEAKPSNENSQETITFKQYSEVIERLQSLESLVEKQSQALEDLRNKLQIETDMRMLLQEKVSQGFMQV